jgi:hypothetical protein
MPGADLCIAQLLIKQKLINQEAQKVVKNWCNGTLGKSQAITPVKTGKLRRSGNVTVEKNTLTEFYCRISFPVEYAAKVHELPIPHRVGQSQFLRIPYTQESPKLVRALEEALRKVI